MRGLYFEGWHCSLSASNSEHEAPLCEPLGPSANSASTYTLGWVCILHWEFLLYFKDAYYLLSEYVYVYYLKIQ